MYGRCNLVCRNSLYTIYVKFVTTTGLCISNILTRTCKSGIRITTKQATAFSWSPRGKLKSTPPTYFKSANVVVSKLKPSSRTSCFFKSFCCLYRVNSLDYFGCIIALTGSKRVSVPLMDLGRNLHSFEWVG